MRKERVPETSGLTGRRGAVRMPPDVVTAAGTGRWRWKKKEKPRRPSSR